ncbi:hypothetical protein [Candidatus Venteria ishoeyi]|nr:hypothetical protein [Candidatus Venteria ishoeyi]
MMRELNKLKNTELSKSCQKRKEEINKNKPYLYLICNSLFSQFKIDDSLKTPAPFFSNNMIHALKSLADAESKIKGNIYYLKNNAGDKILNNKTFSYLCHYEDLRIKFIEETNVKGDFSSFIIPIMKFKKKLEKLNFYETLKCQSVQ